MAYPDRGTDPDPDPDPEQAWAAYGQWYWSQVTDAANQRTRPRNRLVWAVVALGVATYVVSCAGVAQPGDLGWGVRFATLAAVVAALGVFPEHSAHHKLIAALAVMGFLEQLSPWISASGVQNPSWATIVVLALTAVQALTAIAVLLAALRVLDSVEHELAPYDAYTYYDQPAQQSSATHTHPVQQTVQGQATAQAATTAPEYVQQSAADRYALYTEYVNDAQSPPTPPASSPQSSGPTQAAQPAASTGIPASGVTESIQLGNDPPTGSAGRSSSR